MKRTRTAFAIAIAWTVLLGWGSLRAGQPSPNRPDTYAPQALRNDARLLWDLLASGHGGLERYAAKDALEKRFTGAIARIEAPRTVFDFYRELLPLVAAIHDGHTGLSLPASAVAWLDARPTAFPFELRFLDGKAYLFRNLGDDRTIDDGSELLAIDGKPVSEVVEPLVTCAGQRQGHREGLFFPLSAREARWLEDLTKVPGASAVLAANERLREQAPWLPQRLPRLPRSSSPSQPLCRRRSVPAPGPGVQTTGEVEQGSAVESPRRPTHETLAPHHRLDAGRGRANRRGVGDNRLLVCLGAGQP